MKTVGNIIWVVFGGLETALEYFAASIAMMMTVIGIPFGLQTFKIGILALWPFGSEVNSKPMDPGCLTAVMNIIWFVIGGVWIFLTHVGFGLLFAVTIIGLPFARQHFKLAGLALAPFGKEIRL